MEVDQIDKAIEATQPVVVAGAVIDLGVTMADGRVAHLMLPIPLTPVDVARLVVALADVITGRAGQVAAESDDIKTRMAARGLSIPGAPGV